MTSMVKYFVAAFVFLISSILVALLYVKYFNPEKQRGLSSEQASFASESSSEIQKKEDINRLYRWLVQSHSFYRETIKVLRKQIPAFEVDFNQSVFKNSLARLRLNFTDSGDPTGIPCKSFEYVYEHTQPSGFQFLKSACDQKKGTLFVSVFSPNSAEHQVTFDLDSFKDVMGKQMTVLGRPPQCAYVSDSDYRVQKMRCWHLGGSLSGSRHFEFTEFEYGRDDVQILRVKVVIFKDLQTEERVIEMKVPFAGKISILDQEEESEPEEVSPPRDAVVPPAGKPPVNPSARPVRKAIDPTKRPEHPSEGNDAPDGDEEVSEDPKAQKYRGPLDEEIEQELNDAAKEDPVMDNEEPQDPSNGERN